MLKGIAVQGDVLWMAVQREWKVDRKGWCLATAVRDGYCESFNAKLRDELLNGEISCSLAEAERVTEDSGNTTTSSACTHQ